MPKRSKIDDIYEKLTKINEVREDDHKDNSETKLVVK